MDDNGDEDSSQPSGTVKLGFNVHDTDICRTSVDFGRYFVAGCIAGGCLRSDDSISCQNPSHALIKFTSCSHINSHSLPNVCLNCAEDLVKIAWKHADFCYQLLISVLLSLIL